MCKCKCTRRNTRILRKQSNISERDPFSRKLCFVWIQLYDKKLEIRLLSPKCDMPPSDLAQYRCACATVIQQMTDPSSSSEQRRRNKHAGGSENININIISETFNCLRLVSLNDSVRSTLLHSNTNFHTLTDWSSLGRLRRVR